MLLFVTGIESRPFPWEYQYCHDALGFDVLSGANVTLHVTGSTLWILWCCKCDHNFCGSQTTLYSNREEPCGKCNKIIIFPLLSPDVNTCHWGNWKSIHYPSLYGNVMYKNIAIFGRLNPFTPKSDQCQILLQPHQKYYITQYGELAF